METNQPTQSEAELLRLENLQEQIRLQSQLNEAMRADGLRFYRPHEKQDLFHRASARLRAVFAGNRFGKSMCGMAEDGAWLRGERAWMPVGDQGRTAGIPQRPVKGLLVTTDWDKVDEIFTNESSGKLWRCVPAALVAATRKNHSGAMDQVHLTNGSQLRFDTVKSFMANPQGSESSDWDFIHIDEPCPEQMFKAQARGLIDRGGWAWFTLTALSEPWIIDLFYGDQFGGTPQEDTWSVVGSIYDNPYLLPGDIAAYEKLLTEDEKQCRLHGIPLVLSGLVYKQFRHDKHVMTLPHGWAAPNDPPKDYCIHVYIDPHPQTPTAVLFCAVSPQGYRFYYDEIFEPWTVDRIAEAIQKRIAGRRLVAARIDPIAWVPDPVRKAVPALEYRKQGIPVLEASKDLSFGIINAQTQLARDPCAIVVLAHMRRMIWEFRHYVWKADGSNKPVDKDDHMMENFYRCELSHPTWSDDEHGSSAIESINITAPELGLPQLTSGIGPAYGTAKRRGRRDQLVPA